MNHLSSASRSRTVGMSLLALSLFPNVHGKDAGPQDKHVVNTDIVSPLRDFVAKAEQRAAAARQIETVNGVGQFVIGRYPLQMELVPLNLKEKGVSYPQAIIQAVESQKGRLWVDRNELERHAIGPNAPSLTIDPNRLILVKNDPFTRCIELGLVKVSPQSNSEGDSHGVLGSTLPPDATYRGQNYNYRRVDARCGTQRTMAVEPSDPLRRGVLEQEEWKISDVDITAHWNNKKNRHYAFDKERQSANLEVSCFFPISLPRPPEANSQLLTYLQREIESSHQAAIEREISAIGASRTPDEVNALEAALVASALERALGTETKQSAIVSVQEYDRYLLQASYGLSEDSVPEFRRFLVSQCEAAKSKAAFDKWSEVLSSFNVRLSELRKEQQQSKSGEDPPLRFHNVDYPWHTFSFTLPLRDVLTGMVRQRFGGSGF